MFRRLWFALMCWLLAATSRERKPAEQSEE